MNSKERNNSACAIVPSARSPSSILLFCFLFFVIVAMENSCVLSSIATGEGGGSSSSSELVQLPGTRTSDDDDDDNRSSSSSSSSSSSDQQPSSFSPTSSTNNSSDDLLLSDVNAALEDIVSSNHEQQDDQQQQQLQQQQPNKEEEDENSSKGRKARKRGLVFLSEPQVAAIRQLQDRVQAFHARRKRRLRQVVTGDAHTRVRDHARNSVRKRVRRVVTGSSDRALRDWLRQADTVKAVDKFSFMLGVTVLLMTEFVLLRHPAHFGSYYVVLMSTMMALRFYMYARSRYLYFLLDFCYFANAACFASVFLLAYNNNNNNNNSPIVVVDSERLRRLNFAIANGVLLGALLAWRNSLVFHSLDKVTSIALHFLPSLLTYLERWSDHQHSSVVNEVLEVRDAPSSASLGWRSAMFDPLAFYMLWQFLYILKTEIVDYKSLQADPTIQTSLRWLTRDAKNPMHKLAKRVCRATGILAAHEDFQPEQLKTKVVFWTLQCLFMLFTLLPTPLLFRYRDLHTAYILLVLAAAIYNGSNYYFEVFAARYLQQLEAKAAKHPNSKHHPHHQHQHNNNVSRTETTPTAAPAPAAKSEMETNKKEE